MKCKDYSVSQVLVGLHRVGIVGLYDAIGAAEASGLEDREAIVDFMLDSLAAKNYIPDRQSEAYRIALWREYLRHRGERFSDFFSAAPVTVRGAPGPDRDEFVEMVRAVFSVLELRPIVTFEDEGVQGSGPELEIRDEIVVRGALSRRAMEKAVRHSLSDW